MNVNISISGKTFSLEEILAPFIIKPLFLLFIYYGMFSRISGLLGLTGGMTAVLITFALFSLACIHMFLLTDNNRISVLAFLVVIFFLSAIFTPLVSGFIYNERMSHILRYVIELGVSFGIFYFTYYCVRERLISPKFIIYSFVGIGIFTSLQIFATIFGMSNIYRIGGDLGGLNYIGNTLAVSTILYIYVLNAKQFEKFKKFVAVFFFMIVFLSLFFTGTRAGFIAFVAALMLYQIFGIQSRKFTKYAVIFTLLIVSVLIIIWTQIDLKFLFQRYTYDSLKGMALIRFNIYYNSVADLTFAEFMFGRADLASMHDSLRGTERYINPHNVFLSLIRFNGIFPFLIFFSLFVILSANYLKIYFRHRHKPRYRIFETTIIVFLSISFINVMLSGGKFTRNFFLFFALGYAVGYIDMLRRVKSEEEYSELIL